MAYIAFWVFMAIIFVAFVANDSYTDYLNSKREEADAKRKHEYDMAKLNKK